MRASPRQNLRFLSFRVPEDLAGRIATLADSRYQTLAEFARQALLEKVENEESAELAATRREDGE